jgi:hypothetical protein
MHLFEKDLGRLAQLFQEKYGQVLIGETMMGQFHNDFQFPLGYEPKAVKPIHSRKLIALGKKAYLDCLVDAVGKEANHIRLKGVNDKALLALCKRKQITVEELFEDMARNNTDYTFDLVEGKPCFKKTKTYQMVTLPHFTRKVKFSGPVTIVSEE